MRVLPTQRPALYDASMEAVPKYKFDLQHVLDNVVVQVLNRHPDEPTLLGLYEGVPHTERTGQEGPDIVSIYRLALCDMCEDMDDLENEVFVTVIHEVAHAAGIDDDRLHELGWG
jgi:predicted Zn-dependent protease with MMP-like domain